MTTITLDKPFTVVAAQQAVTSDSFVVTYIEENYGYLTDEQNGMGRRNLGRGSPMTVMADIEIGTAPGPVLRRSVVVWQGDEYLAVRGTWTDQDLYAKIKQMLESES